VEVDVNGGHEQGHVKGAVGWNWTTQLNDVVQRDILSQADFERLMSASCVNPGDTLVLYGDNNNWFAAFAFWQAKLNGHNDVRLMDGGRKKWADVESREMTTEKSSITPTSYEAAGRDEAALRSLQPDVRGFIDRKAGSLVDVRSPAEFTGEILAPPGLLETAQRGGHIPGAVNIPWSKAVNEDGTFKAADELAALYGGAGVTKDKPTIAYCRIGERSLWFV
jgi:thiosulfate/3-mercaptopyruvate sulfurtransferase